MLIFHHDNGVFKADKETIGYVSGLLSKGSKSMVILDMNDTPVEINNINELLEKLTDKHDEAIAEYHLQMTRLNKARDIKKVVDI